MNAIETRTRPAGGGVATRLPSIEVLQRPPAAPRHRVDVHDAGLAAVVVAFVLLCAAAGLLGILLSTVA